MMVLGGAPSLLFRDDSQAMMLYAFLAEPVFDVGELAAVPVALIVATATDLRYTVLETATVSVGWTIDQVILEPLKAFTYAEVA